MNFFTELRRRNVLRVGAAYIVTGWLIIQVVETVLPAFGFGDAATRLVVILFGIGLIPILIFAWAFELTPEGLRKESDIDRSLSITPQTGKKLDRLIIIVLTLALAYFAVDKFVMSPSREAAIAEFARQEGRTEALVKSYGDQSIAVLPFVDMSPQGDQEYFSDGISEELLNLLARIPELRVISRSSAFTYKGKDVKLSDIARELNVAHILEGSVRKAGNQVRITAQLIDARSDTHLWSETYDRPLDNIFALQDEISAAVVEQLKIKILGDAPTTRETDPAAYALFLRARHLRRQTSAGSLEQSMKLLQQVLEIDPSYIPALDDLISVVINQSHTGERTFIEGYELARNMTLQGLKLDPDFGRLYIQLGWIEMIKDGDMKSAAKSYQRGLELDPTNITSIGDSATLLMLLGRLDDAIELSEYTNERDPVHPVGFANLGNLLLNAGRYEEAITSFQKALELSPDYGWGRYALSVALMQADQPESALVELEKESAKELRLTGRAMIYYTLDEAPQSEAALQALINEFAQDWSFFIAQIYAFRGETDEAFNWIEIAIEQGSSEIAELHINTLFSSIHDDPRWAALMEQLGKSPEQLAAIKFELPRLE
jgi:TolB-like protein/lipoprotein NlpI